MVGERRGARGRRARTCIWMTIHRCQETHCIYIYICISVLFSFRCITHTSYHIKAYIYKTTAATTTTTTTKTTRRRTRKETSSERKSTYCTPKIKGGWEGERSASTPKHATSTAPFSRPKRPATIRWPEPQRAKKEIYISNQARQPG